MRRRKWARIEPLEPRTLLAGTGLRGEYFNNADLSDPVFTRVDPTINFNWGAASPDPATIESDSFSVRWTGQLVAPASGEFTFYLNHDDGLRAWGATQLAINDWTVHSSANETALSFPLVAGQSYGVRIEYFDASGDAQMQFRWSGPGISKQIVPQSALFAPGAALPALWTENTIGTPQRAANAKESSDTFTLRAGGNNLLGNSDQFDFLSRSLEGDGEIVARIASFSNTSSSALAGVMFRDGVAPDASYAAMLLNRGSGGSFARRSVAGGAVATTSVDSIAAPYWVKISRSGETFMASVSGDGSNWTIVGSLSISMGATLLVGLVGCAKNGALLNTANFDNVAVTTPYNGWQKFAPKTTEPATELNYFIGKNSQGINSGYFGAGGNLLTKNGTSGGELVVNPNEGAGSLELRGSNPVPGDWWSAIARMNFGEPVNWLESVGAGGFLKLHMRFAQGNQPLSIEAQTNEITAKLNLGDYGADPNSRQWQSIWIPIADFKTANPLIDLTRITILTVRPVGTSAQQVVTYIDQIHVTSGKHELYDRMVKVDQVGYLPGMKKLAVLGYVPGGATPKNLNSIAFNIRRDDNGQVVQSGTFTPFQNIDPDWDRSGDVVYNGDFTSFQTTGTYVIEVPELGQYSAPFKIGADVYNAVFRDSLRFFYYARSGVPIVEPYAEGFTRQAYFANDSAATYHDQPGTRDVQGGWFDAGDAHKDMHAQPEVMWFLLETLENHVAKVSPGSLNLPESDATHSDLFGLIKTQLEWIKKMQNADGSVHYTVEYADQFASDKGVISGVSSYSAAALSMIFAKAYLQFSKVPAYQAYANDLLAKAQLSWTWLEAHPTNVVPPWPTGGYIKDADQDMGMRCVAAVELFEATGQSKFNDFFKAHYQQGLTQDWGGIMAQIRNNWATFGLMDYIDSTQPTADATLKQNFKNLFITQANWILDRMATAPYQPAMVAPNHIFWGSNGLLSGNVLTLTHVYAWTGQQKYLDAAADNVHWILGRNPADVTMLSGHGTVQTDVYSFYWTDLSHQPPGYLIGGLNEDVAPMLNITTGAWKAHVNLQLAPILEPQIGWNAEAAYAFGYFASMAANMATEAATPGADGNADDSAPRAAAPLESSFDTILEGRFSGLNFFSVE